MIESITEWDDFGCVVFFFFFFMPVPFQEMPHLILQGELE